MNSWRELHCHLICLNTDHDGGAARAFIGISIFWFRERPKHFKKASHLLVLWYCLLVESMESVVNSDDLIEDWGFWRQEAVGNLETT